MNKCLCLVSCCLSVVIFVQSRNCSWLGGFSSLYLYLGTVDKRIKSFTYLVCTYLFVPIATTSLLNTSFFFLELYLYLSPFSYILSLSLFLSLSTVLLELSRSSTMATMSGQKLLFNSTQSRKVKCSLIAIQSLHWTTCHLACLTLPYFKTC